MAPTSSGTQAAPAATTTSSSSYAAATAASQDVKSTKTTTPAAAQSSDPIADTPGEAALLVSEFPPPPHYYRRASIDDVTGRLRIKPPKIPHDALARGTRRAKAAADRARAEAEAERLRQGEESSDPMMMGDDKTGAILGGVARTGNTDDDDDDDDDNNNDNVVAVFGEIVEDPMLVEPLDPCDDPTIVRDEVKRLNEQVLQLFVRLVQDLVHRPAENKYVATKCVMILIETIVTVCVLHVVILLPCVSQGRPATSCRTRCF